MRCGPRAHVGKGATFRRKRPAHATAWYLTVFAHFVLQVCLSKGFRQRKSLVAAIANERIHLGSQNSIFGACTLVFPLLVEYMRFLPRLEPACDGCCRKLGSAFADYASRTVQLPTL